MGHVAGGPHPDSASGEQRVLLTSVFAIVAAVQEARFAGLCAFRENGRAVGTRIAPH